jgi:hypothetical protein
MCYANLELGLLVFIAWMCSLKLVRKFLPVWPEYFNGQLLYFRWWVPLSLKVSAMCFSILDNFSIVLVILKDVSIFVFLNSLVMILVSFPVYVMVAHFCLFSVMFCSMRFGLCLFWCSYWVQLLLRSIVFVYWNSWSLFVPVYLTCVLYLHMNVPTKKWFSESWILRRLEAEPYRSSTVSRTSYLVLLPRTMTFHLV